MNRPEKSPEPSMEDILASIRRIISDEDRSGADDTVASTAAPLRRASEQKAPQPTVVAAKQAPARNAAEDDVYTLTDDLVFPEAELQVMEPAPLKQPQPKAQPALEVKETKTAELKIDEVKPVEPHVPEPEKRAVPQANASTPSASSRPQQDEDAPFIHPLIKLRAEAAAREQAQNRAQAETAASPSHHQSPAQTPRPVWSRREMPQSPATPSSHMQQPVTSGSSSPASATQQPSSSQTQGQSQSPALSARATLEPASQEAEPLKPLSSKAWMEDIQLPVPEEGPVSLLGSPATPLTNGPRFIGVTGPEEEEDDGILQAQSSSPAPEEVAAMAQSLAKSAVVSMPDEELAEANNFDFAGLDDAQRTSVSETFVDALEYSHFEAPEASVFARDAASAVASSETDGEDSVHKASERARATFGEDTSFLDAALSARDAVSEAPKGGEPFDEAEPVFSSPFMTKPSVSDVFQNSAFGRPTASAPSPTPLVDTAPVMQTPVVQAQYMGQSNAVVPSVSRSLEDSVREMLRPMLVQWLNEHMPRILENAIREEIAARGLGLAGSLPPKKED